WPRACSRSTSVNGAPDGRDPRVRVERPDGHGSRRRARCPADRSPRARERTRRDHPGATGSARGPAARGAHRRDESGRRRLPRPHSPDAEPYRAASDPRRAGTARREGRPDSTTVRHWQPPSRHNPPDCCAHRARLLADPLATLTVTEGKPVHDFVRAAAALAPPTLSVDVAINNSRQVTAVFAGTLPEAHRAACAFVERTAVQRVAQRFDVVVSTNSGHPLDRNLYQA